ncbi:MAG TPA: hypothetical protein VFM37_14560 [Pseudonocardiaceae bacterium]|nr:hypothetical protein [Pseudonocardiaceae bacterium]
MLRLSASTTVSAIDTRPLLAVVPALIRRWRALPFDQGCVDDRGRRREGLCVEFGAHPRPGTGYRLIMTGDEPAGRFTTTLVELLADDPRRFHVRLRLLDGGEVVNVELEHPDRPISVLVDVTAPFAGNWLTRGPLSVRAKLDLAALPPARPRAPQLTVQVSHPRARGSADGLVAATGGGRWKVDVKLRAGGRGVLRPLVAVTVPFIRRIVARELGSALERLARSVEELDRELRASFDPEDPQRVAEAVLRDLLDGVPEHLPDASRTGLASSDG